MTQVIRGIIKKFTSPNDILDDKSTNDGLLQKIFKSHKSSLKDMDFSVILNIKKQSFQNISTVTVGRI